MGCQQTTEQINSPKHPPTLATSSKKLAWSPQISPAKENLHILELDLRTSLMKLDLKEAFGNHCGKVTLVSRMPVLNFKMDKNVT